MWLRLPTYLCSVGWEAWISALDLPQRLAVSCMSRGKSMQPQFWRSALQKGRLTTLLSGLTFAPSTLQIGLESMRLSEDSPVRISVLPESRPELSKATEADSGSSLPAPFAKHDPESSSWRTSQGCLVTETWDEFLETWPKWGSMRSGACSARRSAAPATGESGCSFWPTAQAHDSQGPKTPEQIAAMRAKGPGVSNLNESATEWGTPNSHERTHSPRNVDHGQQLANQADQWQTPTANPATYTGGNSPGYLCLPGQVQQWPTPQAQNSKGMDPENVERRGAKLYNLKTGKQIQSCLDQEILKLWRTPDTLGAEGPRNRQDSIGNGHQVTIAEQAEHWPTPAAHEARLGYQRRDTGKKGTQKSLTTIVMDHAFQSSHPDPTTMSNGKKSSSDGLNSRPLWGSPRTTNNGGNGNPDRNMRGKSTDSRIEDQAAMVTGKKKLNANFVDWMQGLPIHWSDVTASIDSAQMETWRSRFRSHLRSLLSQDE